MTHSVGPEEMREFLASGNVNRKHTDQLSNTLAAVVCESDPEMTQVVATAALCYAYRNFDDFAKHIGLDDSEASVVKLWLSSTTALSANGAQVMREIREDAK